MAEQRHNGSAERIRSSITELKIAEEMTITERSRTSPLKSGALTFSSPIGAVEFKRRSMDSVCSIHDYCRASNSKTNKPLFADVRSPDRISPDALSNLTLPISCEEEQENDELNPGAENDIVDLVQVDRNTIVKKEVPWYNTISNCFWCGA